MLDQRQQLLRRARPLVPRLQDDPGDALVRSQIAVDDKAQIGLGKRGQSAVELVIVGFGIVEIGVLRRLGHREQHALVLRRREFGAGVQVHEDEARQHRGAEQRGHRAVVERAFEAAAVPAGQARKGAVDQPDKAAVQHLAGQQQRAHHRRQGHRDDARDDHRAGEGKGEFAEQRAGDPAEKADRRIDGGQGQGHRDDRAGDLARADQRRLRRGSALLDVAVDVFDDDDRIVDDEPDRQHHRQQRQQVQAEPQSRHDDPGADQRQRDRHDRDHHRARGCRGTGRSPRRR